MATTALAPRGLAVSGLSQACSHSCSANRSSIPFVPLRLRSSEFLAGGRRLVVQRECSRQVVRQQEVARAAIVPERAAEVKWEQKRKALIDANVRHVKPKDARRMVDEDGYQFLDVRPDYEFKEAHPETSQNVQLYRAIQDWTPYKIVRRAGFAFFGIFKGTEENPNFIEDVRVVFPDKNAKIIVACTAGGTTRPSSNFPEGKQSRSLIAAYYLVTDGYKNVAHLDNGLMAYFSEQLPAEFGDDNN